MPLHDLCPHPDFPPSRVRTVGFSISDRDAHWLTARWRVEGAGTVILPPFAGLTRREGLWRTTCFELFIRSVGHSGYSEWNFSPSQAWAAYDFVGHRSGMAERQVARTPVGLWRGGRSDMALFDVAIWRADLPPRPWIFQATAVIEEAGGRKSYWAMRHPAGPPDFHDDACFTGRLAAPDAP